VPSGSASAGATSGPVVGATLPTTTAHLPDARLIIDNQRYRLLGLTGFLLVLIPPNCRCTTAVSRLASLGGRQGTILVGTQGTVKEAQRYQAQLDPRIATHVEVALDGQGVLQKAVPAAGLTAVVISPATSAASGESVAYANNLTASDLTSGNTPRSAALAKALGR